MKLKHFLINRTVICITPPQKSVGIVKPKVFESYTIRDVILDKDKTYGYLLHEINNIPVFQEGQYSERSFPINCFINVSKSMLEEATLQIQGILHNTGVTLAKNA